MKWIPGIALVAAGIAAGVIGAGLWPDSATSPPQGDWIARAGDQYVTRADFEDAMRRRGGATGRYHDPAVRRALLDQLLLERALVARALDTGLDQQPEVRRSLDQILINRVVQDDLRPRQQAIEIDPAAIEAFYDGHADEYTIPARRRVAMLFFELGQNASEETRQQVMARAQQARTEAVALESPVRDFGALARTHSDHQASRYRGGVLGWIGDGDPSRYSYPEVVIATARRLTEPGQISDVVQGENGLYLVRLVDNEPQRDRSLDELASGIRQRLLRERHVEVEQEFQREMLAAVEIEIRDNALADVTPPGPERRQPEQKTPPAMPVAASQGGTD
ncbi:MAG: peptidyl-prolyl cis-trans isomerase [Wenzhouxiangellaceae bacterium]|nr:peptidyl-prolyl cis-trans isomerase [Wenzhouxiangellaceae bacterium]